MNKIRHTFLCRSVAIAATFLATAILQYAFADEQLYFDVQEIAQWQNKSFNGESTYQLTQINNRKAVAASSQQSASARYYKNKIDLKTTPYLNWSWQVEDLPNTLSDDSTKSGDDYAARIYVVFKTGFAFWKIASLNYVWANQRPKGDHWHNAYTNKVVLLAVDSGSDAVGQWQSYKVNVAEDIKKYWAKEVSTLTSIAIMADSDDSQSSTKSYFGDIWFSAD
ncbi:MAG: DUF3047 domain-containing protein [Gammaproteobacteria bacterium]|nr:DUF3047 domain-containing protein [Gammaproteobacteria bacterium]